MVLLVSSIRFHKNEDLLKKRVRGLFPLEKYVFLNRERTCFHVLSLFVSLLFDNLGYDPGGDGAAAFSDGEA